VFSFFDSVCSVFIYTVLNLVILAEGFSYM
jgi:hypothetical protein